MDEVAKEGAISTKISKEPGVDFGMAEGMRDRQRELSAWRKERRIALLEAREAMSFEEHLEKSLRILDGLSVLFKSLSRSGVVGFYWPFRREVSVRPFIEALLQRGGSAALPVVVAKGQPLAFRMWEPGSPMARGVYDIPHPTEGAPVQPDVLIVPLVGFDSACYRLGYGGGFYDRTLSASEKKVVTLGVGFEMAMVESIRPQAYDVPMDFIVTERRILQRDSKIAP